MAGALPVLAVFAALGGFPKPPQTSSRISYEVSDKPEIHGPRVIGGSPRRTFLFRIPATGSGPLRYAAEGLPSALGIDSRTGIIRGTLLEPGIHKFTAIVTGPTGVARRKYRLVVDRNALAMTPPMGWSSWNVWGKRVDDEKVREAADAMVRQGLVNYGYQYVNVDDSWQSERDIHGSLKGNERFPDMKKLGNYIHDRGLKFGIYSSPGPETCAGYPGSLGHEQQDADTFADWGVDYLKYDICSYLRIASPRASAVDHRKPYRIMGQALNKTDRDIVYSICQYGYADVESWGKSVGGHLWRTGVDLTDDWSALEKIAFDLPSHAEAARPNGWNDPDMLVVGMVGWGKGLRPTKLTPDEQITHLTAWAMEAAPLILGCDLTNLDAFTKALVTNHDMIDVDQDPLGKAATVVSNDGQTEVWVRPLYDGTKAVAFFNRTSEVRRIGVRWSEIGMSGEVPIRDVWMRKDLTPQKTAYQDEVPAHGAVFLRVGKIVE